MNWFPIGMVVTLWFAYTHFVKPPDQYAPNLDIHVDINSFWFDRETIKHTDTIHAQELGRPAKAVELMIYIHMDVVYIL